MTCGIYAITNVKNGKMYIGQSVNIEERKYTHLSSLRKGKGVPILQRAWNKYGEKSFEFSILEKCSKAKLNAREKYWIKFYGTFGGGYNGTPGGTDTTIVLTLEERLYRYCTPEARFKRWKKAIWVYNLAVYKSAEGDPNQVFEEPYLYGEPTDDEKEEVMRQYLRSQCNA